MQFLASWIANNWGCTVMSNVIGLNIKVRPIDVVWRTRKEECKVELKKILNIEELDTSALEYFQQRVAAAKLVLDGLSVWDWEKLEADVVKIREKGHEPEEQQQCVCPVNHLPECVWCSGLNPDSLASMPSNEYIPLLTNVGGRWVY